MKLVEKLKKVLNHRFFNLTVCLLLLSAVTTWLDLYNISNIHPKPQITVKPKVVLGEQSPRLSTLENAQEGYKFLYPEGYKIVLEDNGIWVVSKNNRGKVIVYVKGSRVDISIEKPDDITFEEDGSLNQAEEIIKKSFQFTKSVIFEEGTSSSASSP